MSIFTNPRFRVIVNGIQRSRPTQNVFYYSSISGTGAGNAATIAPLLQAEIQTPWLEAMSEKWTWLTTQVFAVTGAVYTNYTRNVNEPGLVAGEVLPQYNSVNLTKIPDPTSIDPPAAMAFKQGRMGLPGVPESFQDNGELTIAALGAYDTLAQALHTVTIGVIDFQMYMFRPTVTSPARPAAAVLVDEILVGNSGTQNTRK